MSWKPRSKSSPPWELARDMGGAEQILAQHDAGRLTVRERIERLLDPGSFHEIGVLAGRTDTTSGQPRRLHGRPTS